MLKKITCGFFSALSSDQISFADHPTGLVFLFFSVTFSGIYILLSFLDPDERGNWPAINVFYTMNTLYSSPSS